MPSHLDTLQTPGPVNFRRLARGLQSVAEPASFCVAFGSDFGGFWKRKPSQKWMFEPPFCDVFFECVFASIFIGFVEARNLENIVFASREHDFFEIDVFKNDAKKRLILGGFWETKKMQNRETSCSKACCF